MAAHRVWRCSRQSRMGRLSWWEAGLPMAGGWGWVGFKIPPNPWYSMIPWLQVKRVMWFLFWVLFPLSRKTGCCYWAVSECGQRQRVEIRSLDSASILQKKLWKHFWFNYIIPFRSCMVDVFSSWLNPSGQHLPWCTLLLSLEKIKRDYKIICRSPARQVRFLCGELRWASIKICIL